MKFYRKSEKTVSIKLYFIRTYQNYLCISLNTWSFINDGGPTKTVPCFTTFPWQPWLTTLFPWQPLWYPRDISDGGSFNEWLGKTPFWRFPFGEKPELEDFLILWWFAGSWLAETILWRAVDDVTMLRVSIDIKFDDAISDAEVKLFSTQFYLLTIN